MVSTATRNQVWSLLLDSARLARYYRKLSSRMINRNNWRLGTTAFFATSAAVSLLNVLPSVVEIVANVGIAGLALWMMVGHHSQKLGVVTGVSERCMEIQTQTRSLWLNLGQLTDAQARERLDHLDSELDRVTSKPANSGVPDDDALNQTCTEEAYEVIRHQYAA